MRSVDQQLSQLIRSTFAGLRVRVHAGSKGGSEEEEEPPEEEFNDLDEASLAALGRTRPAALKALIAALGRGRYFEARRSPRTIIY